MALASIAREKCVKEAYYYVSSNFWKNLIVLI
jgi:hypothetical protein